MMDPDLQAIWHEFTAAQAEIILVADSPTLPNDERLARLTTAQASAKRADELLKSLIAKRP
jgi:hypothetical protein